MDINLQKWQLKISLIEIDQLKPHEKIIERQVDEIASEILRENNVRDPMIVDDKDYVILDGMHRYNSLKKLGCTLAPCCLVNYDLPQIKVGSWYRFLNIPNTEPIVKKILGNLDLNYEKSAGIENPDLKHAVVITDDTVFKQKDQTDTVNKAKQAVKIEKSFIEQGYEVVYEPENTFQERLRNGLSNVVIPVPIFTKAEIRKIAASKHMLPHKVTRHFIPSRPLRLNIPLPLLHARVEDIRDANKELDLILSKRRMNRKPSGSIIDMRRYQEELLIFEA